MSAATPLPSPLPSARRWHLFALALLLFLSFPWWQALHAPLTSLDDPLYIQENPDIHAGLSLHSLATAFTTTRGNLYLPLTWLSLTLDIAAFGPAPAGMRATNILLHTLNSMLVYALLMSITRRPRISLWAAAIFAVHPLRAESVLWITERKDVLSTCFGLLSLLAYLTYARSDTRKPFWYALSLIAFLFSLLAKPMLVTLPLLLLLLDAAPLARLSKSSLARLLLEKLPFFLLAAAFALLTARLQAASQSVATTDLLPISFRLANALLSPILYLRDTLYPFQLAFFYPYPHAFSFLPVAAAALVLLLLTAGACHLRTRLPQGRLLLIGWLWFLLTLLPVLGLLQSGAQARADRFTYLPSIGLLLALIASLPRTKPSTTPLLAAAAAGSVAALLFLSFTQARLWCDPLALYLDGIAHTDRNYMLKFMAAEELRAARNFPAAAGYYQGSAADNPLFDPAFNNLGITLMALNRPREAAAAFARAATLVPDNPAYAQSFHRAAAAADPSSRPAP